MDETAMEILRDAKHGPGLKQALLKLYEEKTLCDVTLTSSDGVELQAHWLVLSAHSEFLRHLAVSRSVMQFMMTESGSLKLNIDTSTLKTILDYLYSGDLVVTKETLGKIEKAAKVLQLSRVLILLEQSHLSCLGDQSLEAESRILEPMTVHPVTKYMQPVTAEADRRYQAVSGSKEHPETSQPHIFAVTSLSTAQTSWTDSVMSRNQQHIFHEFNSNSALNKQDNQTQEIQTHLKDAATDLHQTSDVNVDFDDAGANKRDFSQCPPSPTLHSDNEFEQQIILDSLTVSRKRGRPGRPIVISQPDMTCINSKKGRPLIDFPEEGHMKTAPVPKNSALRTSSSHIPKVVFEAESSITTETLTTRLGNPVTPQHCETLTTQHSGLLATQQSVPLTSVQSEFVMNQQESVTSQRGTSITDPTESAVSEDRALPLQQQEQKHSSSGRVETSTPCFDFGVVKLEALDEYEDGDYSVFENTDIIKEDEDNIEAGNQPSALSEITPEVPVGLNETILHPPRTVKRKRDEYIFNSGKRTSSQRLQTKTEALQQATETSLPGVRHEDPQTTTSRYDTSIPVSDYAERRCSVGVTPRPTVHKCDFCRKNFGYLSSLLRHTRTHHRTELMNRHLEKIRFGTAVINETHQNDQSNNSGTNDLNNAVKGGNLFGSEDGQSLLSMKAHAFSQPTHKQKPSAFGQTGRNGIQKKKRKRKRFRFNTGKRDSFRKEGFFVPSKARSTTDVHHNNLQAGQIAQNDQLLADNPDTVSNTSDAVMVVNTFDMKKDKSIQGPRACSQTGTKEMQKRRRKGKFKSHVGKSSTVGFKDRKTHQKLLQSKEGLSEAGALSQPIHIHECQQCGSILSCTSALNRHMRTIHNRDKTNSGCSNKKTAHNKNKIISGFINKKTVLNKDKIHSGSRFVSRDPFGFKLLPNKMLQNCSNIMKDVSSVSKNLELEPQGDSTFLNRGDNCLDDEVKKPNSLCTYACHLCGNKYKYNYCLTRHLKINHGNKVIAKKSKIFGNLVKVVISKRKKVVKLSKAKSKNGKEACKTGHHIPVLKNISKWVSVLNDKDKDEEAADKKADLIPVPKTLLEQEISVSKSAGLDDQEKSVHEAVDQAKSDIKEDLGTETTTMDCLNSDEQIMDESQCSNPRSLDSNKTPNRASTSPARLTCRICKRQYSRIDTVNAHFRAVHMNVSRYMCPCKKEFKWSSSFSTHKKKCPNYNGKS